MEGASDDARADGRALLQRRRAKLQSPAVASAFGSASVRLGQSAAVAGVRAEVCEASADFPDARGRIVASVELPALCSSAFRDRHGRAASVSGYLSNALVQVLNSKSVLDPAHLDIREGLFWVLYVDVICLNYDGNAFDLCVLAALGALQDTLLPALADEGLADEGGRMVAVPAGTPDAIAEERRVQLLSRPMPVTFAQLSPGQSGGASSRWAVDPSALEEEVGASVSLCLVGDRWLVYHQGGGGVGAEQFLTELMPAARSFVPDLVKLFDELPAGGGSGLAQLSGAIGKLT